MKRAYSIWRITHLWPKYMTLRATSRFGQWFKVPTWRTVH